MDEDSHSTDLSVSSEEGRATILLAHYNFWFYMRQSRLHRKIAQKCLEILPFFLQFAYFTIRSKKILLFRALFGQLFKKLRELFWKISSNLWKAGVLFCSYKGRTILFLERADEKY